MFNIKSKIRDLKMEYLTIYILTHSYYDDDGVFHANDKCFEKWATLIGLAGSVKNARVYCDEYLSKIDTFDGIVTDDLISID